MRTQALPLRMKHQNGAAIVEFAIIGALLFALVLAIFEFGRAMFLYDTMQEISRRGARSATVRWVSDTATIKNDALFGATTLPGGPEITSANVFIRYLRANGVDEVTTPPADAGDNMAACNDITRTAECITYVEVSVRNVQYTPLILKPASITTSQNTYAMPQATTVVYAESLGFTN